jgi:hypothetical protein
VAEVREFLDANKPDVDGSSRAKVNPGMTRLQAWQIFDQGLRAHIANGAKDSDPVYRPDWQVYARENRGRPVPPLWKISIRNINKEFGKGAKRRGR